MKGSAWTMAIAALALLLATGAPLLAQEESAGTDVVKQEVLRRRQVAQWARKDPKVTPKKIFLNMYSTVAEGHAEQYELNTRMFNRCKENAETALKKNQRDRAEGYVKLGKLYKDYAEVNKKVVEAYKKADSGIVEIGCGEAIEIEKKILKIGGRPTPRKWFTNAELDSVVVE